MPTEETGDNDARNAAPHVSVVIPAFGVADWLDAAITSALAQEVPVEVIVVDDDSPDTSAQIARSAAERDPRVLVTRNLRHKGVCGARNTGLAMSRGSWVVFLDGDDALLPGALANLVGVARESAEAGTPVSCVFGSFVHVDEQDAPIDSAWLRDRADALLSVSERPLTISVLAQRTFNPPPGAQLIDARALRECGGWDESLTSPGRSEDFEVVMRLASIAPIALSDAEVLLYRQRADSRSSTTSNNRRRALTRFAIVRRAPRRLRRTIGRAQGHAYGRLSGPRVADGLSTRNPRRIIQGVEDRILAVAFPLWGVLVTPLPRWKPGWPPVR